MAQRQHSRLEVAVPLSLSGVKSMETITVYNKNITAILSDHQHGQIGQVLSGEGRV